MRYLTQENITVKLPLWIAACAAIWIVFRPVVRVPGPQGMLVYQFLTKFVCIQFLVVKRGTMFTWVRIWPLYGIAVGHLVVTTSALYLVNNSPEAFDTVARVCALLMAACGNFLFDLRFLRLPRIIVFILVNLFQSIMLKI